MPSPLEIFRDDVLAGHVALVTGGGTGICRGIAHAYARFGADVCIVSRKPDVLTKTAEELSAATGRKVLAVAGDVRDPDAIGNAVKQTIERFGKLDTLVNGAAGNFLAPAAGLSPNGFKTVIEIDLVGTFNASRAAFEALQRAGNGLVLNISATLHYHGTPLQIHASAAKAGVDAITRNLAVEWGRFGIRACGIAPGPIGDTEGMRRLAPGELKDKAVAGIPAGRFGTIEEIAAAAVYLRSPAGAYVTGHVMVVDGGHCVGPSPIADGRLMARRAKVIANVVAGKRARKKTHADKLVDIARELATPSPRNEATLDLVAPARPISMQLIAGRGHYERVLQAVLGAKVSVWIATANVKELMVEDRRAKPGRRRSLKKSDYVSVLAHLDELAARGVELRLLHAELPSGPFRREIAEHPRLVAGDLALRRCPRVHLKAVIVDGELLYLGSANWTGAGLGAKGSGRRNFELGFVTDDALLLDQIQALYERIWSGGECGTCKLREECPGPLVDL